MSDPGAIRHDLDDLPTRFAMASNLVQRGDLAGGHNAFAQIVGDYPKCHEAHYMLGRVCMAQGRMPEAIGHLERAEALDPGHPEYTLRLGQLALMRNDDAAAIHWLEKSLAEVEKASVELEASYAKALGMARRFEESVEAYRRACAIAPDDASLWLALAGIQRHLHDLDGAEASLQKAIACDPSSALGPAELALMYERSNRLADAHQAVEAALRIDPEYSQALAARARLIRREGDREGARRDLERAIASAPTDEARRQICLTLAQILDELGDYDEAYKRILESKKPLEAVPASLRAQGDAYEEYIHANRRVITKELVEGWRPAPPDDRESPVFFVGFPRSGTTLLEQMLAAHPRFVTTDERMALSKVRAHIRVALEAPTVPESLGRLDDDQIRRLRKVYWDDIDELFGPPKPGVRIVDKHPLNTANLAIVRRLFPDAPVLMSLRDPRDVCVSCMTNLTRSPMAAQHFRSFESTTNLYAMILDLWLHFREALGLRYTETKYEDVIADTEREVRRVLSFLGEQWTDEVMQFRELAQQRAIRSPSYEQVTRKLHPGAIGRWRNYERQMGPSLDTLAPFVKALGYD